MEARKAGLVIAVVLGLLTGPALAVGATRVFAHSTPAATEEAATTLSSSTTLAEAAGVVGTTQGPSDLEVACGPEGRSLVAREADGTITEIEKAALEALRPICESVGMSLAGESSAEVAAIDPEAGETPSTTVATVATPPRATSSSIAAQHEDDPEQEDGYEYHEEGDD